MDDTGDFRKACLCRVISNVPAPAMTHSLLPGTEEGDTFSRKLYATFIKRDLCPAFRQKKIKKDPGEQTALLASVDSQFNSVQLKVILMPKWDILG